MTLIRTFELPTPIGELRGAAAGRALALLSFPGSDFDGDLQRLAAGAPVGRVRRHPALTELRRYFAGRLTRFTVPVDLRLATAFGRLVLERLMSVPFGAVMTYGELARIAGRPGAARAVGGVMGANPVPIVVP